MHDFVMKIPPKNSTRGRNPRTPVDKFQTLAWYNYILDVRGPCTSYHLEQTIREKDLKTGEELFVSRRLWDEYKTGTVSPSADFLPNGKPGAVLLAESHVPMSAEIYRHLLWRVMRTPFMRMSEAVEALETFKREISNHYFDPTESDIRKKCISLDQNLWMPVTVKLGDCYAAMDHLAVNLMFLRLDVWSFSFNMKEIALNIANTLESVSFSPWIGPFHVEMYDWCEANIWKDMFDTHYELGNPSVLGWRKINPAWERIPRSDA